MRSWAATGKLPETCSAIRKWARLCASSTPCESMRSMTLQAEGLENST